jgi:hypothetical protein
MNVLGGTQRMVMDGAHFDQLTKGLSRRRILQGLGTVLVGGTLAALGPSGNATAAKSGRCKRTPGACETCKKGKCNKKNGKKQCKAGKITPKAEGTVCSGGACQSGRCVAPDGTVLTPDRGGGTGDRGGATGPPPPASQGVTVTCPRGANEVRALGSDRVAQTFTAPVSGQLTSADIPITGVIAGAGTRVEIHTLDGSGVPTPTVLASDQIDNLPSTPLGEVRTLTARFAPAASVQAGTSYALVLTVVDPMRGFGVFTRREDPCPGQAFFDSFADGTFALFDPVADFVFSVTIID